MGLLWPNPTLSDTRKKEPAMGDDPASQDGRQPESLSGQIDEACRRFEAAWKAGQRVRIEDYLGSEPPAGLLVSLVAIDMEWRWRAAAEEAPETTLPQRLRLADYIAQHPDLGPLDELPADLIVQEYYARQRWGDRPSHDQYIEDFGRQHPLLREMLREIDRELAAIDTGRRNTPQVDAALPKLRGQLHLGHRGIRANGNQEPNLINAASASDYPNFPGIQILEEIAPGTGGMGRVFKARDLSLDKIVALKTVRPHLMTQKGRGYFVREARYAASLDHPNIVKVFTLNIEHDPPYYVMDYVGGRPLDEACRGKRPEFVARLLEKIARILAFAHRHGVVHRDIKPGNIIVDSEESEPHITDFGLAKRWESGDPNLGGREFSLVGTPRFIAPEVYAREDRSASEVEIYGPEIDIYALGVTMYRLLTGRHPFDGKDLNEIRNRVLAGDTPLPKESHPEMSEPLQRICLKAMEYDPSARYESADAMADDLRRFIDGREVLARPSRYNRELQGRLKNHCTEIRAWHEQNLINVPEMDRLLRSYSALLAAESPWQSLSQRFPFETVVIRLGGWLVLLSSLLWPVFYWPDLGHFQRVLSVGFPVLALNAVGWFFYHINSRRNARIFLGIAALLLPLLVTTVLSEYDWLRWHRGGQLELLATLEGEFAPTNLQMTIAAASFVLYCMFLFRMSRARLFVIWLGVGIYLLSTSALALGGLKYWVLHENVARALLWYFCPCLLLASEAIFRNARGHNRDAAALYIFFPLPLAALMTCLAWYGSEEWLSAHEALCQNQTRNLWWMADGVFFCLAAAVSLRAKTSFVRFWGEFFLLLVPVSLLVPANLLFREGINIMTIGGEPLTLYELLCGFFAVGLIFVGTRISRSTIALPGLIGLSLFVFRVTHVHFRENLSWPLCMVVSGGVAMLLGVTSTVIREKRSSVASGPFQKPVASPPPPPVSSIVSVAEARPRIRVGSDHDLLTHSGRLLAISVLTCIMISVLTYIVAYSVFAWFSPEEEKEHKGPQPPQTAVMSNGTEANPGFRHIPEVKVRDHVG